MILYLEDLNMVTYTTAASKLQSMMIAAIDSTKSIPKMLAYDDGEANKGESVVDAAWEKGTAGVISNVDAARENSSSIEIITAKIPTNEVGSEALTGEKNKRYDEEAGGDEAPLKK